MKGWKSQDKETAKQTRTSILSVKRFFTQISTQPIVPAIHLAASANQQTIWSQNSGHIWQDSICFIDIFFLFSYRTLRTLFVLPRSLFDLFECHKKILKCQNQFANRITEKKSASFAPDSQIWRCQRWKIFSLWFWRDPAVRLPLTKNIFQNILTNIFFLILKRPYS